MPNSMLSKLEEPIGIITHDAGSSNMIFSLIKKYKEKKILMYLEGPAKNIWKKDFPNFKNDEFNVLINECKTLLTGTSSNFEKEHIARKKVKFLKKKNIVYLDNWTNYEYRFIYKNKNILPDEIWVSDDKALEYANSFFPSVNNILIPNFYRDEIIKKYNKSKFLNKSKQEKRYYICQNRF